MSFVVKATEGEQEQFVTGAVRGNQKDKIRYDLIGHHMKRRLAIHLGKGAAVYGERNWEKGQNTGRTAASLQRHVEDYISGDRSEDHLAAVIFNAMSIIHVEEEVKRNNLPVSLLDQTFYQEDPEFSNAFMNLSPMQDIIFSYMSDQQDDSLYCEWQVWTYLKKATFPSIEDQVFAELLADMTEKGWIVPKVVEGEVRPQYAIMEAYDDQMSGRLMNYDDNLDYYDDDESDED